MWCTAGTFLSETLLQHYCRMALVYSCKTVKYLQQLVTRLTSKKKRSLQSRELITTFAAPKKHGSLYLLILRARAVSQSSMRAASLITISVLYWHLRANRTPMSIG